MDGPIADYDVKPELTAKDGGKAIPKDEDSPSDEAPVYAEVDKAA